MGSTVVTQFDSAFVNSTNVQLDAAEFRRIQAAGFAGAGSASGARAGILRHGDSSLAVTVDGSDVATIQAGAGLVTSTAGGSYVAVLAASVTQNLVARSASPRVDVVVLEQLDSGGPSDSAAISRAQIKIVDGTPSATPAVPTTPTMSIELGRINVPAIGAGAASVDSSYRPYAAAIGAATPVATAARLPASAPKFQRAIALDTGYEYVWSGTAWVAQRSTFATLSTTSGWSGSPRYKVDGDTVKMSGFVSNGSAAANTWVTCCTLPVGARPSSVELFAIGGNTGTTMHAQVLSTGEVQLWSSTSTSAARGLAPIRFDLG